MDLDALAALCVQVVLLASFPDAGQVVDIDGGLVECESRRGGLIRPDVYDFGFAGAVDVDGLICGFLSRLRARAHASQAELPSMAA